MRLAILQTDIDNAEWASRHAIAAAIADVLLHDHSIELGAEDRPGRTGFQARRRRAMLADIAHHQPVALEGRHCGRTLAIPGDVLDKMKMPPGRRREVAGIVVAGAAQPQIIGRQRVPFLAGDFAGLAADAQCRIGKEPIAAARLDPLAGGQLGLVRDDPGQKRLGIVEARGWTIIASPPGRGADRR